MRLKSNFVLVKKEVNNLRQGDSIRTRNEKRGKGKKTKGLLLLYNYYKEKGQDPSKTKQKLIYTTN